MDRAVPSVRGRGGEVLAFLGVGLGYYLGARVGLALSLVERNVTPLWPPTGIALAAFLLLGRRTWPAVAVAALAVNLPISAEPVAAVATAAGNTLSPLVAAVLLERAGFRRQLDRGRDALLLVFPGALLSMVVSATIGTAALYLSGAITAGAVGPAWAVWWTGDAMGVLAVAPFLLCLPLFRERDDWTRATWAEEVGLLLLVAAVSLWCALAELPLLFLALPTLGLAAWRLQLRAAAPAALIASVVATWAATHHRGAFAGAPLAHQMLTLQAFNACVALTSFILAALVSERIRATQALAEAASVLEERVEQRTEDLTTANARLIHEIHARSVAQDQLLSPDLHAGREREIAQTLQRSLLPGLLPEVPGVEVAARYLPAGPDRQVCGDWYDVVPLPGGQVALAVGDVTGRGLQAAATMGQLRMALRAYAVHDASPTEVLRGVHQLADQLPSPEMATVLYVLVDPDTHELRFANAGHLPALVVADGQSRYLRDALAAPVGVSADDQYPEGRAQLAPGTTVLLFTNGLVSRRGTSLDQGLERLARVAARRSGDDVETLCDHVLAEVSVDEANEDDIALVALRLLPPFDGPLRLVVRAEPTVLAQVRRTLRRWLRDCGVSTHDGNEVLIACGEACANVVQHAYDGGTGQLELTAALTGDVLELSVHDHGRWRPAAPRGGGWGLSIMEGLMDTVEVSRAGVDGSGADGSTVTMRRRVTPDASS